MPSDSMDQEYLARSTNTIESQTKPLLKRSHSNPMTQKQSRVNPMALKQIQMNFNQNVLGKFYSDAENKLIFF